MDDAVEKIKVNTVFSKPREYSNVMLKEAGASALSNKEPSVNALTGSNSKLKGISGDLSRLVIDHKLHKKNKRRIKNLINLIGNGKKGNGLSSSQNKLALN